MDVVSGTRGFGVLLKGSENGKIFRHQIILNKATIIDALTYLWLNNK